MKTDDFFNQLKENYKTAYNLMMVKNKDYANINDPFSNFKGCELINIDYKKGILVRIMDKIKRIANLLDKSDVSVKDESIEDTLLDAINYLNILLVAKQNEKTKIKDIRS